LHDASDTRAHIEEEKNLTKAFNKTRTEEQRPEENEEDQNLRELERELAEHLGEAW
jgi:hypothetical protein